MIVLFLALLSLATLYFTRLLQRRGLKTGSVMVALLYLCLVVWAYAVFILDVADFGFAETETRFSLLYGSSIYHSFVELNAKLALVPLPLLEAMVAVAVMIFMAAIAVALHGVVEISRVIYRFVQKNHVELNKKITRVVRRVHPCVKSVCFIRLYCRANC